MFSVFRPRGSAPRAATSCSRLTTGRPWPYRNISQQFCAESALCTEALVVKDSASSALPTVTSSASIAKPRQSRWAQTNTVAAGIPAVRAAAPLTQRQMDRQRAALPKPLRRGGPPHGTGVESQLRTSRLPVQQRPVPAPRPPSALAEAAGARRLRAVSPAPACCQPGCP